MTSSPDSGVPCLKCPIPMSANRWSLFNMSLVPGVRLWAHTWEPYRIVGFTTVSQIQIICSGPGPHSFPILFLREIRQYSRQLNVPSLYHFAHSLNLCWARQDICCPFIGQRRTSFVRDCAAAGQFRPARMHGRKFASHSQKPFHTYEREF